MTNRLVRLPPSFQGINWENHEHDTVVLTSRPFHFTVVHHDGYFVVNDSDNPQIKYNWVLRQVQGVEAYANVLEKLKTMPLPVELVFASPEPRPMGTESYDPSVSDMVDPWSEMNATQNFETGANKSSQQERYTANKWKEHHQHDEVFESRPLGFSVTCYNDGRAVVTQSRTNKVKVGQVILGIAGRSTIGLGEEELMEALSGEQLPLTLRFAHPMRGTAMYANRYSGDPGPEVGITPVIDSPLPELPGYGWFGDHHDVSGMADVDASGTREQRAQRSAPVNSSVLGGLGGWMKMLTQGCALDGPDAGRTNTNYRARQQRSATLPGPPLQQRKATPISSPRRAAPGIPILEMLGCSPTPQARPVPSNDFERRIVSFQGDRFGLMVKSQEGVLKVVNLMKSGEAKRKGVRINDVLVGINNQPLVAHNINPSYEQSPKQLEERLDSLPRPVVLHFNDMDRPYVPVSFDDTLQQLPIRSFEPAHSGDPAYLAFKEQLRAGICVKKMIPKRKQYLYESHTRVLWARKDFSELVLASSKSATLRAKNVFAIDEIATIAIMAPPYHPHQARDEEIAQLMVQHLTRLVEEKKMQIMMTDGPGDVLDSNTSFRNINTEFTNQLAGL